MSLDAARGLLACPYCGEPLTADGRRWACPGGHSFDVARQGYLNLAGGPEPVNADTAAMLDARARVQASGLFGFLSRALDDAVPSAAGRLLEVGAGTGHYLAELVDGRPAARGVALDVSRAAARRAARAHPRVASVVADVWRGLPIRAGAADVVLCVFAPRNLAEFARVLTPGGVVLVVTPEPRHLAGLRAGFGLIGVEADKHERLLAAASGHLVHRASTTAESTATVGAELVNDLIGMGPNAFHTAPRATTSEPLELAVRLDVFGL
mgnify:CR=1 FL=1